MHRRSFLPLGALPLLPSPAFAQESLVTTRPERPIPAYKPSADGEISSDRPGFGWDVEVS